MIETILNLHNEQDFLLFNYATSFSRHKKRQQFWQTLARIYPGLRLMIFVFLLPFSLVVFQVAVECSILPAILFQVAPNDCSRFDHGVSKRQPSLSGVLET